MEKLPLTLNIRLKVKLLSPATKHMFGTLNFTWLKCPVNKE